VAVFRIIPPLQDHRRSTGAYTVTTKPDSKNAANNVPIFELVEVKFPYRTLAVGSEDTGLSHQAQGLTHNWFPLPANVNQLALSRISAVLGLGWRGHLTNRLMISPTHSR
jgi:hypothetical protein